MPCWQRASPRPGLGFVVPVAATLPDVPDEAPFSLNLIAHVDQLTVSGPIKTYEDYGENGDAVYVCRRFCGNCGSPIVSELMALEGVVAVKVGTLDDHSWVQPQAEAWCVHKQAWVDLPGLVSMERE